MCFKPATTINLVWQLTTHFSHEPSGLLRGIGAADSQPNMIESTVGSRHYIHHGIIDGSKHEHVYPRNCLSRCMTWLWSMLTVLGEKDCLLFPKNAVEMLGNNHWPWSSIVDHYGSLDINDHRWEWHCLYFITGNMIVKHYSVLVNHYQSLFTMTKTWLTSAVISYGWYSSPNVAYIWLWKIYGSALSPITPSYSQSSNPIDLNQIKYNR